MAEYQYDVCLSFAGEQRDYVREVADHLAVHNIQVFYDEFEEAELWGKDLYEHLAEIYSRRARYCIIFASAEYAAKIWTGHERRLAQERALREKGEYILPARFDDTNIPGLNANVAYIDLARKSPAQIADLFLKKLGVEPVTTDTTDLLADRFGAEWAKDIELFTRFGTRPSFQVVSTALRRAAELEVISKHGVRTRLANTFAYLRIPHPNEWSESESIPIYLEKRFHDNIISHQWSSNESFIDAIHTLGSKLRATSFWEGESSYRPEAAFVQLSHLLLYGVKAIREGFFGVINRIFQIVGDDWIITEWEIIDKKNQYQIILDRFNEEDWVPHVTEKIWVNKANFLEAFETAQMLIYRGIFDGQLPEAWAPRKRSSMGWPPF